jgi:hypothetical protein
VIQVPVNMTSTHVRDGTSPYSKNLSLKVLRQIEEFNIQACLRSNGFSTDAVSALLASGRTELAECDKEIARLHSAIFVLEERKKCIQNQMQTLQTPLSPIRKLPREVLSEIFRVSLCVPVFRIGKRGIRANPRTLMAVCAYWRSIVLSDRQLWAGISLDIRTELPAPVVPSGDRGSFGLIKGCATLSRNRRL